MGNGVEVAGIEQEDAPMMGIGSSLAPKERPGEGVMDNVCNLAGQEQGAG
jgi:hypothetical protein